MTEQSTDRKWSITDGDYLRGSESNHLDFTILRRRDIVKRRIITGIVVVLALGLEIFFIEIIARL